eukprot:gene24478-10480_t
MWLERMDERSGCVPRMGEDHDWAVIENTFLSADRTRTIRTYIYDRQQISNVVYNPAIVAEAGMEFHTASGRSASWSASSRHARLQTVGQ